MAVQVASDKVAYGRDYNASYADNGYGATNPMFLGYKSSWGQGNCYDAVEFDLSSIRSGVTVDSAVLTMYYVSHTWQDLAGTMDIAVNQIEESWVEGTGTTMGPTNCVGTDEFCVAELPAATKIATENIAALSNPVIQDEALDALVEGWINGTTDNYGVYMCPDVLAVGIQIPLSTDDDEGSYVANPPVLDITLGTPVSDWYVY